MTTRIHSVREPQARGMIFIHSASAALCPHIEWAIRAVLPQATMTWQEQPLAAKTRRTELSWMGPVGSGAQIASKLASFGRVRFEVTEDAIAGSDGQRYAFTPSLGAFSATTGPHGNIVIDEERIKHALAGDALGNQDLRSSLESLIGAPWDEELEAFRHASENAPVRWLHHVV